MLSFADTFRRFNCELTNGTLWLGPLAFHDLVKIAELFLYCGVLLLCVGTLEPFLFCFRELVVQGNDRSWFSSMVGIFMKARIWLRANICNIPITAALDLLVPST